MEKAHKIDSRSFIVTGASRGIGRATVEALLKRFLNVYVVAVVRNAAQIQDLVDKYPDRIGTIVGQVQEPDTATKAVQLCIEACGRIDGLVLCAGVIDPLGNLCNNLQSDWENAMQVNVIGSVTFLRQAIPALRKTKGRVIYLSSSASSSAYIGMSAYCASKAALLSIAEILAKEEPEICSVSFRPGKVDTAMQTNLRTSVLVDSSLSQQVRLAHSEGRLIDVNYCGKIVANLVTSVDHSYSGKLLYISDIEQKMLEEWNS